MIEIRVIEAIKIVDLDESLFKIKLYNDPMYSAEKQEVVERMGDMRKLKIYWKKHFDIPLTLDEKALDEKNE